MPKIPSGAASIICQKANKYSFEGLRVIDYRWSTLITILVFMTRPGTTAGRLSWNQD